ncbi:ABC transporter, ATP-binding/permease protein [Labilithrix luteola]|uniref:ABC transporter, ATP-binding/permease protein n=1 Tax=Labilithrix luteola TaxID=1391654 RepID=A0A0K1QE55_9BACT|nr:ABC transporter ATP-binding protein [Labilithrix luteola]AKV04044.1 ABC transporter, ATP-binding/permease protein [Labilithrix luteola]
MRRALALVWQSSPAMTVVLAALTLAAAAVPPSVAWAGKRIVDAVVARSREETLRWVGVELVLVVLQASLTRGLGLVRSVLGSRLGTDVNVAILDRATRLELRHFEDPEFYDQLSRARREASSRPVSLVTESFALVQNVLTLAGYAALLLRFSGWVVAVLMVATVPATIAEMRYSKTAFRLRNWRSPESRRLMYLEYVLANDEHAKEVKLFGLGPLFLGRYKELAEQFYREDSRLAIRRAVVTHLLSLLATAAFYGSYAAMALMAAASRLTLGSMTMYVLAFRSGQQAFQSILSGIGSIYEHNLYMSNLFSFLDAVPGEGVIVTVPKTDVMHAVNGAPTEQGIRLENVSFKYPGQEKWVLRNVDLFIPRGQSVALVGQNGAGKTTLVKLVTRLYEPTEGRVLLDGKDVREWDRDELLARFGVVFQDFSQYQLKFRENVGVGSVKHLEDAPRIARAAERGGADAVASGLSAGLEAPLGRWFQDGVELSGGQWQKIALARGFMREQADILVLDEPTAALDAEAEHAVFERFRHLAEGRTTLIISHRFPTVRMADRILVLENGRIAEDGTHAALLSEEKTYARLYKMQAEGYV